jgi:8-amino-7-oxononanoate synthase
MENPDHSIVEPKKSKTSRFTKFETQLNIRVILPTSISNYPFPHLNILSFSAMPPPTLAESMQGHLNKRRTTSSFRSLSTTPTTSIDFSSNDFLSLTGSPILKSVFLNELNSQPNFHLGSGGSRLLDGNSHYAENLEKEIADFHHAEAALLFNSGFDANSGFFSCVPQKGDLVLYDEFIHASVREGLRLSRAGSCIPFSHNSVQELECKLRKKKGEGNVFVAVESLYSMDGDLCPLRSIVECVERCIPKGRGHVVVDEAHSNGVYGERGRGVVCSLGLEGRVFARLHTFGKGLACNGGKLLCSTAYQPANFLKLLFSARH